MKPVTVISASGPRRIAAQDPAPALPDGEEERAGVPGLVWAGVGVAVLALLIGFLVLGGNDREEDPGVVVPTASQTPADVVPDVLVEDVTHTGSRTPRGVLFECRPPESVEAVDTFTWHRDDTDEYGSTSRRRLLVRTDEPVCLDVRMTRGSDNSPSASQCVS
jgi:hypothetical protein